MTNYSKVGQGKVLVFLHGWADSSATFNKIAAKLKGDYTLLMLDLPGLGHSQTPASAWNTDDYSDFVADWLQKIGVDNVYGFITHSFGGSVAINGLAKKKLSAKKLVLLSAAGVRGRNKSKKAGLLVVAKVVKLLILPLPRRVRQKLRSQAYTKIGSDLVVLGQMEPTFKKIINEDMRPLAAKVEIPTLLIYGDKDDQTPVADGEIFAELIKDARLEVQTGAGHFVHQDLPDKVAETIRDFLK